MIPQLINSINSTRLVDNVWFPLFVGFILIVITCGLTIFFVERRRERREDQKDDDVKQRDKFELEQDRERIYDWLYNETKAYQWSTVGEPNDRRWRSTEDISNSNNLTDERVVFICRTHKKIRKMMEIDLWPKETLEEKWAIREFVR